MSVVLHSVLPRIGLYGPENKREDSFNCLFLATAFSQKKMHKLEQKQYNGILERNKKVAL